jgi:hypothetical protein
MGLRKKHQNLRTAAVYGASDSHVWLGRLLGFTSISDPLSQDNMCYCSYEGEFPPLPGLVVLKNQKIIGVRRASESETESEMKVKPAFVFHPLRA